MRILRIISIFLVLVLTSANLSIASPTVELGKWWKNSEVAESLNLTDTQVARIEQSYLKHRKELAHLMGKLLTLEELLESSMKSESMDETGILEHAESVAEARKKLEIAKTKMLLTIRKQLTSEQWDKLEAMRELSGASLLPASENVDVSREKGSKPLNNPGEDEIEKPVLLYSINPKYTDEAKEAKAEGIVVLQAIVRKDGSIDSFEVLRSLGYGLDERAINTIKQEWKFSPGRINGKPVDSRITIEVSFRLY